MTLSLASNIDSLHAQNQLRKISSDLSVRYERLSSGLRINSASDDPAGLAMADGLRADALIAAVAIRNANDGLSLAAIAEAALDEVYNLLSRMAELATQSSNGAYTMSQRSALSSEFLALGSEIDRISRTTEFNGFALLSGSSNITLQVGLNNNASSQITMAGVTAHLNALGLSSSSNISRLTFSIIDTSSTYAQNAAMLALSAVNGAIGSLTSIRGTVAASESRLSSAINYITVARENFVAAESRIRDADVAQEVAEMVRLQVLQQAATAVLAQANQQPATALALLQ